MNSKDKKGYSDRLRFEHEFLEQYTEDNLPLNVDLNEDSIKFSPNYFNKSYQLSELDDESVYDNNNKNDEEKFNLYEALEQHKINEMKEWPKINSRDEFFKGYDSIDEEVTINIMEHLHANPHLFRKIRFLQRNNKALNFDRVPELDKLKQIKEKVVSL